MYWGAGRANEGWPTRNQWVSFENMFNNNKVRLPALPAPVL